MTPYEAKKEYYKKNPDKAKEYRQRYYKKTREKAHNTYKRWTEVDDNIIINIRASDRELSDVLGRSMQSIQIRRSILRKRGLYHD